MTAALEPPNTTTTTAPAKSILSLSRGLSIRPATHADASVLSRYANNPKIARNMRARWPTPYTVDNAHDWIAICRDESKWPSRSAGLPDTDPASKTRPSEKFPSSMAITQNDKAIGMIGLEFGGDVEVRSLQLGYWLGEEYWGQGIVTEVVKAYLAWVWETYPGIERIEAFVYGWNPNSGKVLMKCGFRHEGTVRKTVWRMGEFTDKLIYGLLREDAHNA